MLDGVLMQSKITDAINRRLTDSIHHWAHDYDVDDYVIGQHQIYNPNTMIYVIYLPFFNN